MGKRALIQSESQERADILAKMDELETLVANYFSKFSKTTKGQLSIGDITVEFVKKCDEKIDLYPEVLSQNFNKADFEAKFGGVLDFFEFKKKMLKSIGNWDISAKVCKTDAMFYANKFYGIIQIEANESVKYKPVFDELTSFYKKTASDKTADSKTKTPAATESN